MLWGPLALVHYTSNGSPLSLTEGSPLDVTWQRVGPLTAHLYKKGNQH